MAVLARKKMCIIVLVFFLSINSSVLSLFFDEKQSKNDESIFDVIFSGVKSLTGAMANAVEEIAILAPSLISFATFAAKFLDSNIEEDCTFECPRGSQPVPDSSHVPSSNGCGSMGFSISGDKLPYAQMENCCNEHDICYDTCNSNKERCDVEFKRCLYSICNNKNADILSEKACKASSKLLFTSTLSLGCLSFKEAQRKACKCVSIPRHQGGQYGFRDL